jgi:hypothetical protein
MDVSHIPGIKAIVRDSDNLTLPSQSSTVSPFVHYITLHLAPKDGRLDSSKESSGVSKQVIR